MTKLILSICLGICLGVGISVIVGWKLIKRYAERQIAKREKTVKLHGTTARLVQHGDLSPQISMKDPPKRGELSEHVYKSFSDWMQTCLEANGNQPLNVRDLLVKFARWHGPANMDQGILRPNPPPVPGQYRLEDMEPIGEV